MSQEKPEQESAASQDGASGNSADDRLGLGWLLAVLVGLGICMSLYLLEPEEGRSLVEFGGLVAGTLALILGTHQADLKIFKHNNIRTIAWRVSIWVTGVIIALSLLAFGIQGLLIDSARVITGVITVEDSTGMHDGDVATIRFPDDVPRRDRVVLRPEITNAQSTGSCVDPALLVVTPHLDGHPREDDAVTVRSGDVAELPITDYATTVQVTVLVDQTHDDEECSVDLSITRAVLTS